jgi:chemotaxis response regulator CheB
VTDERVRLSRRLLVIDDDEADRRAVQRELRDDDVFEWTIVEAETAQEGLAEIARHPPDAVVLDYLLPDRNGIDVLRHLAPRDHPSLPPVIFATGAGNEMVAREALRLGAADYLVKGLLSTVTLPRILRLALARRERERGDRVDGVDGVDAARSEDGALPRALVAIGASAGGLEAVREILRPLPLDAGLAVIVAMHLSPDFESGMDEILARNTALPVGFILDGERLVPNRVRLVPPGRLAVVRGAIVRLLDTPRDPARAITIDLLLRSVAASCGARGIAVVASGTGRDGTDGARSISRAGGLVIAQTPQSADFDEMPSRVIDAGAAHLSLEPGDIAGAILQHAEILATEATEQTAARAERDSDDPTPDGATFDGAAYAELAEAAGIALVVVDHRLDVRRAAVGSNELVRESELDVGSRLEELASELGEAYAELAEDARRVVRGESREASRTVVDARGRSWFVRVAQLADTDAASARRAVVAIIRSE